MKIAVIDDGIDKETAENGMHINCHYHYVNHKPEQGIRHGTKVVGIVEKYSSDTKEYEIYDVMNTKETSCSMAVTAALEDLLHHRVDVILMCLVIQNDKTFERIRKLCHELRERGSILIASASNSGDYSFPAVLDDVIGVGRMADRQSAVCWYEKEGIQLLGDVTPEFVKLGKEIRTVFSGTSKAAAVVAAMVSEQCNEGMKSYEQIQKMFQDRFPCKKGNMLEQVEHGEYRVDLQDKQMYKRISDVLKQMGYHLSGDESDCYFSRIARDTDEFAWLIPEIINRLDMPVVPEKMHYFDFISVYALADYLGKYV